MLSSGILAFSIDKPRYLQDRKKFSSNFTSLSLGIIVAKAALIESSIVLAPLLKDESETGEEPDWGEAFDGFVPKVQRNVVKNYCIISARSFMEYRCVEAYSRRYADKLVKDISKSAVRKMTRLGRERAAKKIFMTSFRSGFLGRIAVVLIEQIYLTGRFVFAKKTKRIAGPVVEGTEEQGEDLSLRVYATETATNVLRTVLAVIFGGVGASVGTYVKPGMGTTIGFLVGDSVGSVLV